MKIFDAHVHIYPDFLKKERDKIAAGEYWFDQLSSSKVQKWCSAEELIADMDEEGMTSSCVTTFAFKDPGLCREMNDYLFEASKKYAKRIYPMGVISPTDRNAAEEARRVFDMGFVGIGELFPDGQNFDITEKTHLEEICNVCYERDKFIMIHTAEQMGHQYIGKGKNGAREAAAFCRNFPNTRVIFAHFGGGLWAFEAMPEMREMLKNARYDTAAMPWLYQPQIIDAIFSIGAGEKILFGTDRPIVKYPRYEKLFSQTKLNSEQKELLLWKNAENFITQSSSQPAKN